MGHLYNDHSETINFIDMEIGKLLQISEKFANSDSQEMHDKLLSYKIKRLEDEKAFLISRSLKSK